MSIASVLLNLATVRLGAGLAPASRTQAGYAVGGAPSYSAARAHVPEAILEGESAHEVMVQLPQPASGRFSALFTALDGCMEELGVSSYGLSIPSLQEIIPKSCRD